MPGYNQKECPRCAIAFECKAEAIAQCQCNAITINKEEQQYINKQFAGCICINCIKDLVAKFNLINSPGKE